MGRDNFFVDDWERVFNSSETPFWKQVRINEGGKIRYYQVKIFYLFCSPDVNRENREEWDFYLELCVVPSTVEINGAKVGLFKEFINRGLLRLWMK